MHRIAPLLLLFLVSPPLAADDCWIFLKDGRVGRGDISGEPVVVAFPDGESVEVGSDQIDRTRTDRQIAETVDAILRDLGRGRKVNEHKERLKELEAAAVPRLIDHLQGEKPVNRQNALFAFCYAWSPRAVGPVACCLDVLEPSIRRAALLALSRHVPPERLYLLMKRIVEHDDPTIAIFGFETAERIRPDITRIARFLAEPECWDKLIRYLPRYQSPDLIPLVRTMLDKGKGEVQRTAVVSLAILCDNAGATRRKMHDLLDDASPEIREAVGEYFAYHGTESDLESLEKRAAREKDIHAKTSLVAAAETIRRRSEWLAGAAAAPEAGTLHLPESGDPAELYAAALELLQASPAPEAWYRCFEVFRDAEPLEPRFVYRSEMPAPSFLGRIEKRLALQAALFANPAPQAERSPQEGEGPPVAERLQPPIRDYLDRSRKSYGKLVDGSAKVFGGTVHVGDDTGWHRDLLTVAAIGNGIVRRAETTFSWGGIVIIEHRGPDGSSFCSLYAHLSPLLLVRSGENVKRGRKIGSIGRTHTFENGGFNAHIHFGIHLGPYVDARKKGDSFETVLAGKPARLTVEEVREESFLCRCDNGTLVLLQKNPGWVGGYLSPARFEAGDHGWVDPQAFIRKRR